MTDLSKLPAVDPDVPNAARMYDYYLGGSHNFAADRAAAERVKAAFPFAVEGARANRFFLQRAVRFCAEQGIDQFLDLGSGIPTVGNVHEAARAIDPRARVAYVDNEPVTVASASALLGDDPLATISMADIRDPAAVLDAPGVRDLLDLSRPVALLTVAVLHFIGDEDGPAEMLRSYRGHLVPGSVHVLTHARADEDPDEATAVSNAYRSTANPLTIRSRDEVLALFGDTELVEPGVVDATEWRPVDSIGGQHRGMWAGIGRIR
ncbi:SAM-dependent methyltransferase [Pseudonocardia kunmingensis]|uniref:SAM-dependent methyltransferase n=1 Tax=Pseudonocardia kunmingensis TaxID=630975 RepID=UPI001B883946|nr:SAM-dependent methyltransferase [Pseudonocardia kunmingensis]